MHNRSDLMNDMKIIRQNHNVSITFIEQQETSSIIDENTVADVGSSIINSMKNKTMTIPNISEKSTSKSDINTAQNDLFG